MPDLEKYRSVASIQKEMICIYDKRGVIKWVNDAYARFFGKSKEEFVGVSFLNFIPKDDRKKAREIIRSINQNDPKITATHRVIAANGSIRWHEWTDEGVFSTEGKIIEYRSVGIDVTELVELRQKLRAYEAMNICTDVQDSVLMVKNENSKQILKMSDIVYIKADLMKSIIVTVNGSYKVGKQIKTLEEDTKKYGFVRIHKSYIVNLNHISKLTSINDSKYKIKFLYIEDEIETSKAGARRLRGIASILKNR